ncbi:MAG TPA: sulfate ABC transporter ATP-binding protein [Methylomirabilota bacterium]|nr:sulfate ABC transporter ATP-binding protein [Methylomirabilota bacterium]
MSVEVKNITKRFGDFAALRNVSLKVNPGELLALLGPSGSGKTTLLRIIGGLEFPDPGAGGIYLHDKDVTFQPAGARDIGFVFQHYALFRHLTVFENIAFGLRVRPRSTRPDNAAITKKVRELLKLIQLEDLEHRYPNQLSGGQRQRVALARALAVEPKVLLLDEPFGALDAKVRKELRKWIRRLHDEIHVTSIFVTHDQDEALEVADRVVVMNEGAIAQVGTPDEVYDLPVDPFVFSFLGRVVALQGHVANGHLILGRSMFESTQAGHGPESEVTVFARPQDVTVTAIPNGAPHVEAIVKRINLAGPIVYLELERTDDRSVLEVEVPSDHSRQLEPSPGDRVYLNLKKYQLFPSNGQAREGKPSAPLIGTA